MAGDTSAKKLASLTGNNTKKQQQQNPTKMGKINQKKFKYLNWREIHLQCFFENKKKINYFNITIFQ